MLRWIKGQHFPPGFDEWCELAEGSSHGRFESHETFGQFESRSRSNGDVETIASSFIHSVTEAGKHWSHVRLDPSASYRQREIKCLFTVEDDRRSIGLENTHILRLDIAGQFQVVECTNLRAHSCYLAGQQAKYSIRLVKCVIGKIVLTEPSEARGWYRTSLELVDCWIGTMVLPSDTLWRLDVSGGGVAHIECPSSDRKNPFEGEVSFKKVFFPSSLKQTQLFQGPHAYRSLYAHLKKLDNTLMANLMRSHQLRSERADEDWFSKVTNWFYGTFANYGMSPGRPLGWLHGAYIVAFIYCYNFDYGTLAQSTNTYVGTYAVLLDENGGRLTRSFLLPLHSIINPFGVFFDPRKLFVPTTGYGSLLLTLQGVFSDILLVMTALSVRRRFKAE